MDKQNTHNEYEIDLIELLGAMVRRWWLILIAVLVGAAVMFGYTRFFVTPLYQSSVSFYVNNGQRTEEKISNADIIASQSLVDTYIVILKYGTTLDDVIDDADLHYTASQLADKISSNAINDTEVFEVKVTDPDPEMATKIAKSISKILPRKVSEVIEGSTVRVVREASEPTRPSSPNVKKNIVLGAAVGFLLSCVYLVLQYLLDDRIRDAAQYLKENYSLPILAEIPDLTQSAGGYYYRSQSGRS